MQQPLVSIIIPSYNRSDTVGQTIDSILNQRCDFEYQIVIGDDCSTDNVREVLVTYQKKYPEKIKLIFHERNIGLGANWATCVLNSKGKYIANCDNDDYWHNPEKLQLQVDFMEANPEYGLCHTDYRTHNRTTGEIKELRCANKTVIDETQVEAVMNGHFKCCNASIIYRKETLLQYVNFDDYIKYKFTLQDWNTWMLLAKNTKFYEMHISTSTFGIETESITRPKDIKKLEHRFAQERMCYKYVCDHLPQNFTYRAEDYTIYQNTVLLNLAYKQKNYFYANKYAQRIRSKSLKVLCARNLILFHIFAFLKSIKS
jgi:glycosyltransferase involved in cell wall biosynthesis